MSLSAIQPSHLNNQLLAAMRPEDFASLEPHLVLVELHKGLVVYATDENMPFIYFPHDVVVSLLTGLPDGRTIETAVLGSAAVIGLIGALTTRRSTGRFVVQSTGAASRIDADILYHAFEEKPNVRKVIFRYMDVMLADTLDTMACNAVHSVEARCCRWILTMVDRSRRATLPLTHEYLSQALAVQRSTISLVMGTLQSAGLIQQGRGAITVVDRSGLEKVACACYGAASQRSERLSCSKNRGLD